MDANNALKLGRLFRVPYGGEGVDFIDQLNYQFTSGIIVLFIVMIGFRQYVVDRKNDAFLTDNKHHL
ncbi:uncharacterized protein DC041_0000595 [Schistosoma bovis]|uniref:Uncharacterized protein n=2 Tax=Schistosoma TaxID=6181 RepID=A0A430QDN1_SCHBO|nr:uncharacterized protein DC041_0000595 [Schistosoma bovis]